MNYPIIQVNSDEFTAEELSLIWQIKNHTTGTLRSDKPKDGRAAYVWRMVAFQVSPNPQHHCMPVTADFGINCKDYTERRAITDKLDELVKRIVDGIPMSQWHGVHAWKGLVR
jgi:hypothetical protein